MSRPERVGLWVGARSTIGLAVPLMAAQVAVVALGLVDTLTFGRFGTEVLAGGGLGTAVFSLVNIMCVGVATAVGNQVAYASGSGNQEAICAAVRSGIVVSVLLGSSACLGLAFGAKPLLGFAGQNETTVTGAALYLSLAAAGLVPSLLFTTLRGLLVGLGNPGPITAITAAAVMIKASLNLGIVYVATCFDKGDQTAFVLVATGGSSTLVYAVMAFALWCIGRNNYQSVIVWPRRNDLLSPALLETLRLGVPIGITYGVEAGFFTAVALIVGRHGEVALAAHHVANQFVYLTFMLAVGMSHAASVQVGKAAGRGQLAEARRYGQQALLIGLATMSTTAALFGLFGAELARFVVAPSSPGEHDIVQLSAAFLWVAACFQWFDGTQNIAMGALRGLKDARATMVAAVAGYWVVGIPIAWIMADPGRLGPIGAWWGLATGLAVASVVLLVRFHAVTSFTKSRIHCQVHC